MIVSAKISIWINVAITFETGSVPIGDECALGPDDGIRREPLFYREDSILRGLS